MFARAGVARERWSIDAVGQRDGRTRNATLREDAPGSRARRGRLDATMLRESIPDPQTCIVYACGPAIGPFDRAAAREKGVEPAPRFLEAALSALGEIGVSKDRIKHESYG